MQAANKLWPGARLMTVELRRHSEIVGSQRWFNRVIGLTLNESVDCKWLFWTLVGLLQYDHNHKRSYSQDAKLLRFGNLTVGLATSVNAEIN